ncbi:hypothetical protein QK290_13565 [Pseudarthrobacter sp. AL07]|uniref:hypothetical protein n=1 Tax=unclassified Pseudarthrobacter TaxID=2647000 RepID=UPI00249C0DB2|nr:MULTISPECIES: hypothetical protein [unclassified Pseudarthrobacter]MDI3195443.1 hypothetical protein [Pseudarthrobacter sp. AL20]MDI3209510.1 hypothetical protein [Pseudarthrobacter sp. AL07]
MKLLLFALLSALCLLRIPSVAKVTESRASWLASMFGLTALYILGTVTPLEVIDSYLGGINVTNLLQAIFALLAIFFFNDSVRRLANVPVRWTYYAPLLSIPIMIVSFALIEDKAPTAADFIDSRMDQLATATYSGTYMLALLFTVLRIIYMLRHKARGPYATFSAGLLVVAAACSCHITYVVLFHFSPWDAFAQAIGSWFDRLFYLGLSVTAAGWLILFLSKQLPKLRLWMIDALWLTALRIRINADQSRVSPAWDLFNETLENGVYKSLIVLHNYQRGNMTMFPESVQGRISQIEAKLDAQT